MKFAFAIPALLACLSMVGMAQDKIPASEWKEYVYSEDAFAITLPSDPHPHKSSQMANGTVYLVPFPNEANFSLHTMEANDRCIEAVHSQKEAYEKNKAGPAGGKSGFKAMSFQEIIGSGYTGVEFVQKLPTGRMDYERWVCGARHLYILASTWNPGEPESKDLRRIVNSFRILSKN
jgi:hypothetical protein